ncbi:uncharacterized protein METZ01_LOCUS289289, partial [marine metagenome]
IEGHITQPALIDVPDVGTFVTPVGGRGLKLQGQPQSQSHPAKRLPFMCHCPPVVIISFVYQSLFFNCLGVSRSGMRSIERQA